MELSMMVTLITGILGSNVFVAWITHVFAKRKTHAEATDITVKTALELERRAHERYQDTSIALEEAERILQSIKVQLLDQENYILYLRSLLKNAGICHDSRDEWNTKYVSAQ